MSERMLREHFDASGIVDTPILDKGLVLSVELMASVVVFEKLRSLLGFGKERKEN